MKDLIFILKHAAAVLELTHAPDGWNDTLVTYERSSTYFGLFRSYSVSLKFVKEGAAFFRNAIYNHGLNAVVEVEIKRLDRATMTYYTAYIAEADLSSFKDDGIMVTVNLADGGLSAMIKKNEKTEYAIGIPFSEMKSWGLGAIALNYVNLEDLFIKIMDKVTNGKISDGTYSAGSQLLYYYSDQIAVTSLYNPLNQTYYIKTTLIDFYKSVHAVFSIGMEIQLVSGVEVAMLRPLNTLFNETPVHHFSSVAEFEFSVKNDQMFNSFKFGYSNDNGSESMDANSYSSFNYDGKVVKELDLTSPYRADLSKLLTLQAEVDEIFFIQLMPDPQQPDRMTPDGRGSLMKTPTGNSSTFYNSLISPRRLADNHYQYLTSLIYHDSTLRFTSGGNDNGNNETSDSGQPMVFLKEYQDIEIDKDYADFTPYRFTIEVGLTKDFNRIITTASTGKISFDFDGNTYNGFIEKVSVKLAGRGKVEFKLIASPDNNFQNLIK